MMINQSRRCRCIRSASMLVLAVAAAGIASAPALARQTRPEPPTEPAPIEPPTTEPARDLPAAGSVLDRAIEAMGGGKSFKAIKTADVTMTMGGMEIHVQSGREGRFLLMQQTPQGMARAGSDGEHMWTEMPAGSFTLLDEAQSKQITDQMLMLDHRMVVRMPEYYEEAVTVDRTEFGDETCNKVRLTHGDEQVHAYFNAESGLIRGMETTAQTPMGPIDVSFTFGQWKAFGDIRLYTEIMIDQMGMQVPISITDLGLNTVEASTFELPEQVRTLVEEEADAPPTTAPADP